MKGCFGQLKRRFASLKRRFNSLTLCFVFAVLGLAASSCNSDVVYDENIAVNEHSWSAEQKLRYEVSINDTTKKYKLALNVRNTTEYPYSNVYFFMNTILPEGKITKRDTIECALAYSDGTWKGKGSSNVKDNRFWIAKNVEFSQSGTYIFEIYQATLDSSLVGIRDVGLHIEYQD